MKTKYFVKKPNNIKTSEHIGENISKKLLVLGGTKLKGVVKISPAKNAILPLIAALLVTKDAVIIPRSNISDYETKLKLLEIIGYKIDIRNHEVEITPSNKIHNQLPTDMIQAIRSSILFFGPLLGLQGEVKMPFPGGDDLKRKLNFHLECLEKMGAKITIEGDVICGKLEGELQGTEYTFKNPSVGATQHIIITAILAKKGQETILNNCAQEPECEFLINFLRSKLGAKITVIGTQVRIIGNGGRLFTSNYNKPHKAKVPQDRIEALTYLVLALMTDGKITIDFDDPLNIIGAKDLELLIKAGGNLQVEKNYLTMKRNGPLKAVKYFQSGEFPNISTDFCPLFCALMGMSEGTSIFTETIYGNNRFKYIEEINKFGAVFRLHYHKPATIVIDGSSYFPSESTCTDIRGGMALLLAALTASGCSTIHNAHHIFRGYQYLIERINSLGGQIKIID